jgi:hypothetical protein|tara:strand:+ start:851 stop:985 length:135 start_codon:yes stop_codon:yes gene_type:complete
VQIIKAECVPRPIAEYSILAQDYFNLLIEAVNSKSMDYGQLQGA